MTTLLRNLFAVILGLFAGGCLNMALVAAGAHVFPPPAGVNMSDAASIAASIHLLEPRHFLFPFLAHALGTAAGAAVAYLAAGSRRVAYAYGIGVLFLAGGISASMMIPAPKWFIALDLIIAYLPMAWLGATVAARILERKHEPVL